METVENVSTTVKLNSGYQLPKIGLGTFLQENLEIVVYEAIKSGIRLIDTASRYQNEKQIGEGINRAINEGIVRREELFIVTKLWVGDKDRVEEAMKKSLNELNLTYVDLYLDHWPMQIFEWEGKHYSIPTHVVWKQMENLVTSGYTRSIGLSNYNVQRIMDVLSYAEIKPSVLQIELNPYLTQKHLLLYCKENNIAVMAYNSLCKNKYVDRFHKEENFNLLDEPIVKELSERYSKTTGQIVLNWAVSQNLVAIPGSSNSKRAIENLEVLKFKLSDEDIEKLDNLNRNARCNQSTQWDFFKKVDLYS